MKKLRRFIGNFIWYNGYYLMKYSNYKLLKFTDIIMNLGNKIIGEIEVK